MEPDMEKKAPPDQSPEKERRAGTDKPGKTPGLAEGDLERRRDKPYPEQPGKTPGSAEG